MVRVRKILPQIAQNSQNLLISGVHLSPLGFAACQSKKCTPLKAA